MSKFYRPVGSKYIVFPVGAVYISVVKTNPSKWFGGTWEEIPGDYYFLTTPHTQDNRGEGGSWYTENTILTVNQMPSHTHQLKRNGNYSNNVMIDTGKSGQWGSTIFQVSSNNYTAQPMAITADNTGGGKGHNHKYQPPFYQIWAWKRTA